jgi:hypothetical protein
MRAAASLEDPGEFAVPVTVVFSRVCGSALPEAFLPLTEPEPGCGYPALAGAPGLVSRLASPWVMTTVPSER